MGKEPGRQLTLDEVIADCEKEDPTLIKYKEEKRKINKCPGGTDLSDE